jgi:transcriptional regulator with XRE-family HTH domain
MALPPGPALKLPPPRTLPAPAFTRPRTQAGWKKFNQIFQEHIGQKLYELRLYNGKNQTEMGEIFGVTLQQIRKYEHGRAKVPPDKLWLIAAYFSTDISYFFDGFDPAARGAKIPVMQGASGPYAISRLKIAAALGRVTSARKLHALITLIRAIADDD